MAISTFDLFSIGIGPSSSHTVGPMRAANGFLDKLNGLDSPSAIRQLRITLYGSLGATGKGHGTDKAVILGLLGETPEAVDTDAVESLIQGVNEQGSLTLASGETIPFSPEADIIFNRKEILDKHPNAARFEALGDDETPVLSSLYYSLGGGFISETDENGELIIREDDTPQPYPFTTAAELLAQCEDNGLSISQLMRRNERVWRSDDDINTGLLNIWQVMKDCVERGCRTEGVLPGGLKVKRRATRLHRQLRNETHSHNTPLGTMDWVNLYALAVNEENAAGGRVVTAPTNGAAGIIPAVLHYYWHFSPGANEEGVTDFLLTAAAIGILYKKNASISGAEVGCQGEVGSACSMAAGALTEALGGTPQQVENAAEIAMEHNLGLTCDPIGGLVQVPCIERNAMAAVKAINASRLAMRGDGRHFVSLDKVIKTMRDTGADMQDKYKETARGGLAVNVVEC
ncbi:MAG: L-serine ammonia-lyase [Gammaproteobacteria bacterium]